MSKFKYLFIFLSVACLYSFHAQAKVCFLPNADGSANCAEESYDYEEITSCPDCVACKYPKAGAKPCSGCGNKYKPINCCDDSGTVCGNPKKCFTIKQPQREVAACTSAQAYKLPSMNFGSGSGESSRLESAVITEPVQKATFVQICPADSRCMCPDEYKECIFPLIGEGEACDAKYKSCKCPASYHKCDKSAVGSGGSCEDSEGTKYLTCECPASSGWTETNNCCGGSDTCTNSNGKKYYKCKIFSTPNCQCGYTYSGSCVSGCTDSDYSYKGARKTGYVYMDGITGLNVEVCANNYCCGKGYWDINANLPNGYVAANQACAGQGYVSSSCTGKFIGCPFNPSMKKCLD